MIKYVTIAIDENNKELDKNFIHSKLSNSVQLFSDKLNDKFRSSLSEYIFEKKVYTEYKFNFLFDNTKIKKVKIKLNWIFQIGFPMMKLNTTL